ncbi:MAG: hypothetical protein GC164_16010 [Phycisphaera sp.]|nr:hypothetical protein [Phycisphaera sp.]
MSQQPTPPRRAGAYFGLHIDLHANAHDTELGRRVDAKMVRKLIRATRPDYIQYDCKGHNGNLAYPHSKISQSAGGKNAKGIIKDALKIYRKVTREEGVRLLAHFSGIWDDTALHDNPRWATRDHHGKRRPHATSPWSDYVTKRMIPQMKEVIDRYDVDGFWVDGDCWAMRADYCRAALEAFERVTGVSRTKVPTEKGQPHWSAWMRIHRDRFLHYVKTWLDEIHAYKPGIELASNWAFSTQSPDPVSLPVDFLSGDYSSTNAVNSARVDAYYLANLGRPWDLMAWGHVWFPGKMGSIPKPAIQLMQEAVPVLAKGGGFQVYIHPDRHGLVTDWQTHTLKEVADFCHEREAVCHKTQPIPQVALLLDTTSLYEVNEDVFNCGWHGEYRPMAGTLHALLEAGHSVDILAEHTLLPQLDRWPVVVVPEWSAMSRATVKALEQYVYDGGSLLLVGPGAVRPFAKALGVQLKGQPTVRDLYLNTHNLPGRIKGEYQTIILNKSSGVKVIASASPNYAMDENLVPLAIARKLGKGRIAAVLAQAGNAHATAHTPGVRELLDATVHHLYTPIARLIDAPGCIDLNLRTKDNRTIIHLGNTSAMPTSNGYFFAEHIPPTPELTLMVRLKHKPKRVTLEPAGKALRSRYDRGLLTLQLPPVHIHSAIVIDP